MNTWGRHGGCGAAFQSEAPLMAGTNLYVGGSAGSKIDNFVQTLSGRRI
jgi:hypothetical protein